MKKYFFPLLVFIVGMYLIGFRLVGVNFDGVPGDMGDGRLNNYFLEHGYLYLTNQVDNYWDAPFFYPEKSTMSMSDNLFGTLPLYALFRIMKFDRETSYQVWFLCLLALNFITCFFCLKKLKISAAASAIGAFIFAFALPVAGGIGHIQMLPKFAFPIIIYCLIRFIQEKKQKYLFFFFLFSVYQMYCGIYLGFMSIMASLLVFFIMVFSAGFKTEMRSLGQFLKTHWISTSIFFVLDLLLLFILLRPYINRAGVVERNYGDIGEGLPTPLSYLYPGPDSLLYNWMRPLGKYITNPHEHTLWMGLSCVIAVALGIYLVRSKKDKQVKFWLVSFLLMILITLNFYGHVSFYAIVYLIPGFEAVRAVSRIVQLELFFLGGLIAVIIDHLVKKDWSTSKKVLVIGMVSLFIVVDQFEWKSGLNSHSKKNSQYRVEFLRNMILDADPISAKPVFVYLPNDTFEVYKYHMDAMLVSQELHIPTINGYSAFSPGDYEKFFAKPDQKNLIPIIDKFELWKRILVFERPTSISLPPQ
jgi:hypothetical protein